jgi:serpin B
MEDYFQYSSNELWSTVRLAYGNASYNMYVLLPNEGVKIEEVIDAVDSRSWEYAKIRMTQRKVDLKLPAFETETDMNLKGIMNSLGIQRAFDPDNAEFNEMITNPNGNVYLGLLKQKSKIKVNEEGTEAAAVTVGGFCGTSVQLPAEPVTFHADRPFIYLIQEQSSNAIFFIGTKVRS